MSGMKKITDKMLVICVVLDNKGALWDNVNERYYGIFALERTIETV